MAAILRHYGAEDVPEGHGDRWVAMRCPFHGRDLHPSAQYCEEKDSFSCMMCGLAGNAVTLLMRHEGLSAREADARATEIAGHPGVSLEAPVGRLRPAGRAGRYLTPRLRRRTG